MTGTLKAVGSTQLLRHCVHMYTSEMLCIAVSGTPVMEVGSLRLLLTAPRNQPSGNLAAARHNTPTPTAQ